MILRPTGGKERAKPTKFIALDCEMVGVGPFGLESALARVSIVNFAGDVVLDEFVLPQEVVTDWRTAVSGVRKEDMVNAKSFKEIQALVSDLLKDRFLVGHALQSDLSALLLSHPWQRLRDTQSFHAFRRRALLLQLDPEDIHFPDTSCIAEISGSRRPALRKLIKKVFGIEIQKGEHNSIIDARAPMALYRLYRKQWEGGNKLQEPIEVTIIPPMSPSSVVSMPASTTVVTVPSPASSPSPAPSVASSSSSKSKSKSASSETDTPRKVTKSKQPDIIISIDNKKKNVKTSTKTEKTTQLKSASRKKVSSKASTGTSSKGKAKAVAFSAAPKSSKVKKSTSKASQEDETANSGTRRNSWWSTLGF
ncbi:3'-5' exonuclease [Serendipita sp. 399]|nr:3'-5' exonuclease [Serendipita sp. 399]